MNDGADLAGLFEYDRCRQLMARIRHDADLIQSILQLARIKEIEAGSFTAIGALKPAKLGCYDKGSHEYRQITCDRDSGLRYSTACAILGRETSVIAGPKK